jgi:2Fe-2S ferredoxin
MLQIIFVDCEGISRSVEADSNTTLMETAKRHGISEIEAQCGGACSCGTCHVYIALEWRDVVGVATEEEEGTLDFSIDVRRESRLACQITLTDAMNGLTVVLPPRQS